LQIQKEEKTASMKENIYSFEHLPTFLKTNSWKMKEQKSWITQNSSIELHITKWVDLFSPAPEGWGKVYIFL